MRKLSVIVATVLAMASAKAESIGYTVSPEIENGVLKALAVEMVLPGEADGETEIELPDTWGGKSELWRGISEFRVSGRGLSVTAGATPSFKLVRHAPGATLTVRYRVKQFWAGEPQADGSNEYRPVIRPGYFHVIGWTVFARPRWSLATPVTVSFSGVPKGWRFASNLEQRTRAPSLAHALESVAVGGDFRVLKAGQLRVAIRGAWGFSDESFIKRLEPIIASHHRFWGDAPAPFLVSVLPLHATPGQMSVGGTALDDAFAFFATSNVQDQQLTRILAHEHLHGWIPRRVGMMPQDNDTTEYWFSEGFTEFYTYRLLARDGLWPIADVEKAFNDVLRAYAFSPARNALNVQLAEKFWSDRAFGDLPYQRGFLFAALADNKVRRASKGKYDLDDVMQAMKRAATVPEGALPPPIRQVFVATMASFGVDAANDIERYIEKGQSVVLPSDVWAACGVVEASDVAEFDRGFDGNRTMAKGNVVTGVDPGGPAYAAGLRDGMLLLRLELSDGGDSRVPLTYRVSVEGKVREISYLPSGKRRVSLQELKVSGAAGDACAARLGGTG